MLDRSELGDLPTIDVGDVEPGDLIFNARPSPLQHLVELAGDLWRHVAIAAIVDGTMSVCEVSGHRFRSRPIDEVPRPPQTEVAVARFGAGREQCATKAATWAVEQLRTPNVYAWDDLIVTGVLLAIRQRAPADRIEEVMGVIRSAEQLAKQLRPTRSQQTFTCSGFVYHAFAQASLNCTPDVRFPRVRSRPARYRHDDRPTPRPLVELLAEAEEGRVDGLTEALEHYSLLELTGAPPTPTGPRVRVSQTSSISADQTVTSIRNLLRIFANVRTADLPSQLVVDQRWVSPGDLWRLEALDFRALLPISPA